MRSQQRARTFEENERIQAKLWKKICRPKSEDEVRGMQSLSIVSKGEIFERMKSSHLTIKDTRGLAGHIVVVKPGIFFETSIAC